MVLSSDLIGRLDKVSFLLDGIDPRLSLVIDRIGDRLEVLGSSSMSEGGFIPPRVVSDAAVLGLRYRQRAGGKGGLSSGEASRAGVGSGVQRAVNLKNRDKLSLSTIKRMKSFFSRHRKNRSIDPKYKDEPWKDRGYVAWLLWGGDPGESWVDGIIGRLDKS